MSEKKALEKTLSSMEATERERNLVAALEPWPSSFERALAIAREHIGDVELGFRIYRREAHDYEVKLHKIRGILRNDGRSWSDPMKMLSEIEAVLAEEEKGAEPCGSESPPEPPQSSE